MKIFLFVTIVIVLVGCNSYEDDYPKIEKEFKLSDELYTKKVIIVESLLEKTGGEKDDEPYDFYAIEHRKHIENSNLIDIELFFMELISDEGLRMDGDHTVIKEVDAERLYFKLNYCQSITKYWDYNYRKTKYLNYRLFLNQEFFFINYKN